MSPCVVFALKLGATVPSLSRGCSAVGAANVLRKGGFSREAAIALGEHAGGAKAQRRLREAVVDRIEAISSFFERMSREVWA